MLFINQKIYIILEFPYIIGSILFPKSQNTFISIQSQTQMATFIYLCYEILIGQFLKLLMLVSYIQNPEVSWFYKSAVFYCICKCTKPKTFTQFLFMLC